MIGSGVGVGVGVGLTDEDVCKGHPASEAILSECSIVTRPFSPHAMIDQSFLYGLFKRLSSRFKGLDTPSVRV